MRGVFFFSPTCPHCETVIDEHLPGIFERFGGPPETTIDESIAPADVAFYLMSNGTLQLLMVDVSVERRRLRDARGRRTGTAPSPRRAAARHRGPSASRVGGHPRAYRFIIETGLAADGLDWPDVPDLASALAPFLEAGGEEAPAAVAVAPGAEPTGDVVQPALGESLGVDRVTRDPLANVIAIVVLALLVASLVAVPVLGLRGSLAAPRGRKAWLVPLLACGGIAISAYLGYVESNGLAAVCGPVGDCNAVQDSEYARLFGVLPTWVLGVVGYALVLSGSIVVRLVHARTVDAVLVAVAAVAYAGTLFSAWLTFLEPFVIGATCMWCVLSALTMLALVWLTAGRGWAAVGRLRGRPPPRLPTRDRDAIARPDPGPRARRPLAPGVRRRSWRPTPTPLARVGRSLLARAEEMLDGQLVEASVRHRALAGHIGVVEGISAQRRGGLTSRQGRQRELVDARRFHGLGGPPGRLGRRPHGP